RALEAVRPAAGAEVELAVARPEAAGQAARLRRRRGRLLPEQRRAAAGRLPEGRRPAVRGGDQVRPDGRARLPTGGRSAGEPRPVRSDAGKEVNEPQSHRGHRDKNTEKEQRDKEL